MTSNLSAFPYIAENSQATPGLWNYPMSIISANLAAIDSNVTLTSAETYSFGSSVSIGRDLWVKGQVVIGAQPSTVTRVGLTVAVSSAVSDYILFEDSSNAKSDYIIGSRVGGTADGLNIWDASGSTMIASFSKQSIRFYQNVVGPVFDVGGALADTYNAATFGTGAQSVESRIQAAISQASTDGVSRVYIPANMYPYSAASVSFDTRVQMVREGGNWAVYDVQAYGAAGTGTADDSIACQSALTFAPSGSVVYFPSPVSRYRCSNLTVFRRLTITGDGRSSELFNNLGGPTMLIKRHPSDSALWNHENQLDGIDVHDLYFNGARSVNVEGLRLERLDHSIFQNLVFEALAGPGLHLASQVRECNFSNIITRWCGSSASTAAVMLDDAVPVVGGEGHNGINFFGVRIIFSHGPALLIETTGSTYSNTPSKTRNINIYGFQFHGPLATAVDFDGTTPFPDSALTHHNAVLGSCRDVRFLGGNATASGQSGAHFNVRGGIGVGSGATSITLRDIFVTGHAVPSTGEVTNANSGISVASGSAVFLENLWVSATSDVVAVSGSSVHFGLNVDLQGASSISSTAYQPANRLTGVFQPRSNEWLSIDEAFRLSTGTLKGSANNDLKLEGSIDNNVAAIVVRTPDGSGVQANRMRFGSGTAPEIVSLVTHQFVFPVTVAAGTAANPSFAFSSETSLGFYRSAASTIVLSYGTLVLTSVLSQIGSGVIRYVSGNAIARTGTNAANQSVFMDVGTITLRDGLGATSTGGRLVVNAGSAVTPTLSFGGSELSLGFYRSGVSTMAPSYGTLNLATQAVRLSMRTLAASSVTASAANTNVAVNEAVFTVGGASGASLCINSGGTTYFFNSAGSAINA